MRDRWYADHRDLVKWGVLLKLAEKFGCQRILQLAFYRPTEFDQIVLDGEPVDLPAEVIAHFRDIRSAARLTDRVGVTVFDKVFTDRRDYLGSALLLLKAHAATRCVVFLDPDTGLEPGTPESRPCPDFRSACHLGCHEG